MPAIVPCLWFDGSAEQAAAHYTAIFPRSAVHAVTRYGPDMPGQEGSVLTVAFRLDGSEFLALNGGPQFRFTEAVSFQIFCADQDEVDHYWDRLTDGGSESQCGWLTDRFGLSWQVVPTEFAELAADTDRERAGRVFQALLGMRRIDIAALRRAAAG